MDNRTQDNTVLSKEDFEKFREFFYEKTGILFDESKRYFVDRRIIERMKATGYDNFKSYFIAIKYDISGKELQNLINALTVNETYFFREEYQFQAMVENMLPDITSRKNPVKGLGFSQFHLPPAKNLTLSPYIFLNIGKI